MSGWPWSGSERIHELRKQIQENLFTFHRRKGDGCGKLHQPQSGHKELLLGLKEREYLTMVQSKIQEVAISREKGKIYIKRKSTLGSETGGAYSHTIEER